MHSRRLSTRAGTAAGMQAAHTIVWLPPFSTLRRPDSAHIAYILCVPGSDLRAKQSVLVLLALCSGFHLFHIACLLSTRNSQTAALHLFAAGSARSVVRLPTVRAASMTACRGRKAVPRMCRLGSQCPHSGSNGTADVVTAEAAQ